MSRSPAVLLENEILKYNIRDCVHIALLIIPSIHAPFQVVKKLRLGKGFEASLKRYESCDIMAGIQQPYKDAIHIYDVLKSLSHQYGHTFLYKASLEHSKFFGDYKVRNILFSFSIYCY